MACSGALAQHDSVVRWVDVEPKGDNHSGVKQCAQNSPLVAQEESSPDFLPFGWTDGNVTERGVQLIRHSAILACLLACLLLADIANSSRTITWPLHLDGRLCHKLACSPWLTFVMSGRICLRLRVIPHCIPINPLSARRSGGIA